MEGEERIRKKKNQMMNEVTGTYICSRNVRQAYEEVRANKAVEEWSYIINVFLKGAIVFLREIS